MKTCLRGHDQTVENVRVDRNGKRHCRACGRERNAAYRRRRGQGIRAEYSAWPDRFWRKVDKARRGSSCWWWTGYTSDGYGFISVDYRSVRAHRVAYELLVGPVPDGLVLDHLCRNRACVNPTHLEPVTNRINALRGESPMAKAARQTLCIRGHELAGENLLAGTKRRCRLCNRIHQAAYELRKRAAAEVHSRVGGV